MKLGVMQPYFFPYIGYWQLINAVDKYVIFDDVNYIMKGWVNRNRILVGDQIKYINVYLNSVSRNKLIKDIEINDSGLNNGTIHKIEEAYRKAPFFSEAFPIIMQILSQKEKNLAKFNGYLIKTICNYLEVKTEFVYSSEIEKDSNLKGQNKIMAICKKLGANDYINAIGGQELYDFSYFKANGVNLHFLKTEEITYRQFDDTFYENLSIVDVMMFNSKEKIKDYLERYTLLGGENV